MNNKAEKSLDLLFKRVSKIGRKATIEEINSINQDCNNIMSDWHAEILLNYPICGLELGWQQFEPEDDFDGINWMSWSNPEWMKSEMIEAYPGIAIYKHGYLNVATCSHGSGDPYFININEDDNPRVLQVFHDVSDNYELIIAEGIDVITESLSDFFQNAII